MNNRNEAYNALKGIAMCMVMFGHIGVMIGGGYAALFFVIMSGVLCRLSYRGENYSLLVGFKYTWYRMYKMLIPHLIGLALIYILHFYFNDWNKSDILGGLFFMHCWTPKVSYFSGNSVEWTVSCLLGSWFLSPFIIGIIKKVNTNFIKVLFCIDIIYIILRTVIVSLVFNKFMLQVSVFGVWILNNQNPTIIIPMYLLGIFLAELLCRSNINIAFINLKEILGLCIVLVSLVWGGFEYIRYIRIE